MEPGLALLSGSGHALRAACHHLAHHAVHVDPRVVLWLDGEHGFRPYDLGELNAARGLDEEEGIPRVRVLRCMNSEQWREAIHHRLAEALRSTPTSMVLVAPFDRLLTHDELQDYERHDLPVFLAGHLRNLARRHRVPILITANMTRWSRGYPVPAALTAKAADHHWIVQAHAHGITATSSTGASAGARQQTLWNYEDLVKVAPII